MLSYNKIVLPLFLKPPLAGVPYGVVATRCRVDDCLAEPRKVLTRPRVPPRLRGERGRKASDLPGGQ